MKAPEAPFAELPAETKITYPRTDADAMAEFQANFREALTHINDPKTNTVGRARGEQPMKHYGNKLEPDIETPRMPADIRAEQNTVSDQKRWDDFAHRSEG